MGAPRYQLGEYNGGARLGDFEYPQHMTELADHEVLAVRCRIYYFTYVVCI
jgi:hypothetical protein